MDFHQIEVVVNLYREEFQIFSVMDLKYAEMQQRRIGMLQVVPTSMPLSPRFRSSMRTLDNNRKKVFFFLLKTPKNPVYCLGIKHLFVHF